MLCCGLLVQSSMGWSPMLVQSSMGWSPGLAAQPSARRGACSRMQLPDFGKMGADLLAKTGLDGNDEKAMEERLKSGAMTFDDFVMQVKLMQKAGSLASMMKNGPWGNAQMGKEQVDEGAKKLQRYTDFVWAMEAEERGDPAILIAEAEGLRAGGSAAGAARLGRIAADASADIKDVAQFVYEFKVMKDAAVRFANGESPEDIKSSMMEEQKTGPSGPKNRAQRRQNERKGKKSGKRAKAGFGR